MILHDYPIEDDKADILRRMPLAEKIAEVILAFEGKESFVMGIEGVWGSGKTSLVNLVKQELAENEGVIFVQFNPWNFTGQNELIADFFATFEAALKKDTTISDLGSTIESYASRLQISVSPSIELFGGLIKFGMDNSIGGKRSGTLEGARKKIDEKLVELGKHIVVVIDDTDRLDARETRLVMKLVKMTANFPNTIFLLPYDRKRVSDKLTDEGWDGEEYLKKIIQVSFPLPVVDPTRMRKILYKDIDATTESIYGEVQVLEGEDRTRMNEIVYRGFQNLFKTIRDIKRYANSLRLTWSIIGKDEVNVVDFIAVEAIRVFVPAFYAEISENSHVFLMDGYSTLLNGNTAAAANSARFQELLNAHVPKEIREPIEGICKAIFPRLGNTGYGSNWEATWGRELRVCAPERFPYYFQLSVPEGGASEAEINELLKLLDDANDVFNTRIIELAKEDRLRVVLSKVTDRVDSLNRTQRERLIASLWSLENQINEERTAIFDFEDIESQVFRIAYFATQKLRKTERGVFLKKLLEETTGFYFPLRFIAIVDEEQNSERLNTEELLLTKEETAELTAIMLTRIQEKAGAKTLVNEKHFLFILFRWKRWENGEVVREYIRNITATREGLLSFLRASVLLVLSSTGNYNQINKKELGDLYPLEELDKLVNAISPEEIKKLDEKDKEAVDLYKNPVELGGRRKDESKSEEETD